MALKDKIEKLRRLAEVQKLWLVYSVLGEEALTPDEMQKIKHLVGKDAPSKLTDLAYKLGRLRSLFGGRKYSATTLEEVQGSEKLNEFTVLERLAVDHARLKAAEHIKGLADDIINGAFMDLQEEMKNVVTEATVKEIVRDATALALMERQAAQQLATTLGSRLKSEFSRDWLRVATTELQSAKVQGQVQCIVNKLDIYHNTDGVNSRVSIIPHFGTCCEDCTAKYTDSLGNPKIFILRDLLEAGSNGEAGVSHKRVNGIHVNWKTTLPPLHPNCICGVHYVPPGTIWKDRKLVVTNHKEYEDALYKAYNVTNKMRGPASLPGVPAPDNTAGPGRPPGSAGGYYEWSKTPKNDGREWSPTESGKGYFTTEQSSGHGAEHEQSQADQKKFVDSEVHNATAWSKQSHPHDVALDHMQNGEITTKKELTMDHASPAFKVTIQGNGPGMMKPAFHYHGTEHIPQDGIGSIPRGTQPARERAAYCVSTLLGLDDHVPPTALRSFGGEQVSMQQWKEEFQSPTAVIGPQNEPSEKSTVYTLLDHIPEQHREAMKQKLTEIAALDLVINNNDRHTDNIIVANDLSNLHAIDHGISFGNGLSGHKNKILMSMCKGGRKFTIPDKLKERLDSTTLGDYKRSLRDSGLQDWEVGQAFLRSRYASYLQDAEGHIDPDKFMNVISNMDGSKEESDSRHYEFRKAKNQLPNQLFESWAAHYLNEASADAGHKDHAAATELKEVGVFMGPGFASDSRKYRMLGKHREYEKTITPGLPPRELVQEKRGDAERAPKQVKSDAATQVDRRRKRS